MSDDKKYAIFLGCTVPVRAFDYELSMRKVSAKLGIELVAKLRQKDPFMPALLQSSDLSNAKRARELGVGFMHKYSKSLSLELRNFIIRNFAFGEFIFRDPQTLNEVGRAADLKALQKKLGEIPDDVRMVTPEELGLVEDSDPNSLPNKILAGNIKIFSVKNWNYSV